MFKREIFRRYSTESEFLLGFINDIAQKSGGRIVCTTNGLDRETPMFEFTVDGSYQITFVRDGIRGISNYGYNVTVSRGSANRAFLSLWSLSTFTGSSYRTIRYSIICNGRAMLLELGGQLTKMIQNGPDISILSTNDGIAGVTAATSGQITTNGALVTKNGTSLYIHDRVLQYDPATPKKLRLSRNKELYDSPLSGGMLAASVPGLHDCMTVPSKLHFIVGSGEEYYSLDSGFDIDHEAVEASTVLEV